MENLGTPPNKIVVKINLENISQEVNEMSNNHLARYLAQEKGISVEEAQKIYKKRKKFRRYFKDLDFLELKKNKEVSKNGK